MATDADPCGSYYSDKAVNPQPAGHNLNDYLWPYMYLGKSKSMISSDISMTNNMCEGGSTPLTVAQGCSAVNGQRIKYSYN